jgi:flagellar biosynthesis/type III secretory pathway protein FliH
LLAAEERKSLPDEVKKGSQVLQDDFRLHYFPNIPLNEPPNPCVNRTSNSDFQRSLFKKMDMDPACPGDDLASETPETPAEDKEDNTPSVNDIKEAAFQKGFLEGKRVGFESGSKKADSVIDSLNQTLGQLENIRIRIYREIEKEVAQLALSIARKIVCHEVKISRETVACVAREALNQVDNPAKIKIKLNPDDLRFIEDTRSQLSRFLHNVDHIRFEADKSIQSGGCLIETDRGDIDARIEKQFQALEESFQTHFEQQIKPESE